MLQGVGNLKHAAKLGLFNVHSCFVVSENAAGNEHIVLVESGDLRHQHLS